MYIGKMPDANSRENGKKKSDMSIGDFVQEIQNEKKFQFDFAMFLAKEMLEETKRLRKGGNMDGVEEERVADSQV